MSELGDRKTYIGGSDAPIIMGVSPFKKRKDLLLEKLALKEPFKGNYHTRYGHLIEDSIALSYEFENDCQITNRQDVLTGICNGFDMNGHIDGRVNGNTIIDFKATGIKSESEWKNGVPVYYYYQALFYMWLDGAKTGEEFIFYVAFVDKYDEYGNIDILTNWKVKYYKKYTCLFDELECRNMLKEISRFIDDIRNKNTGISNELKTLDVDVQIKLYEDLTLLDRINQYQKELKAKILAEMEENNIKKFENDMLSITYVPESTRKGGIDERKLIESGIDLDNYRKPDSKVKSSIRIKLK